MVYDRLEKLGMDNLPQASDNEGFENIEILLSEVDKAIKEAQSNKKVVDL